MSKKIKTLITVIFLTLVVGFMFWQGTFRLPKNKASEASKREVEQEFKIDFFMVITDKEVLERQQERLADYKELALSEVKEDQLKGWLGLGGLREMVEDYKGAEMAWLKASEIYPENMFASCNLAGLYNFQLNQKDQAKENYERCLNNNPFNIQAYKDFAGLYLKEFNDIEKAEAVLLQGLERNQNDPNLLIELAFFYKENGFKEKAIEYFEKVIKILPERAELFQQEIDKLY